MDSAAVLGQGLRPYPRATGKDNAEPLGYSLIREHRTGKGGKKGNLSRHPLPTLRNIGRFVVLCEQVHYKRRGNPRRELSACMQEK